MARSPSSSPTDVTDDPAKDAFFDKLHQVVQNAPPHNITVILTEANATVSCSYRSDETKSAIGISFVESCTNDNLRRLLNLCGLNDLSIADTWFTRKKFISGFGTPRRKNSQGLGLYQPDAGGPL